MSSNKFEHQAFPHGNQTHGGCLGMTLRDYFAGQALAVSWDAHDKGYFGDCEDPNRDMAIAAYQLADAMLKAREEDNE